MVKYIKNHKIVVVAVVFAILLLLVLSFIIKEFFSGDSKALYGNRLDGIESVKITKKEQSDIVSKIEEDSAVSKCECHMQGKIVNVSITVNDDVGADTAKSLANKVLDVLDTDQKKFFDIQVFINKTNGAKDFPIIGYKQNTRSSFSWTKDRAAN